MKAAAIIIISALVWLALLGGGIGYIYHLRNELDTARTQIDSLQKAAALARQTEASAMAARQVENEKAKQRERLMENVLCHNNDWSGIVVPDDVTRMLQQDAAIYGSDSCFPASGDTSR